MKKLFVSYNAVIGGAALVALGIVIRAADSTSSNTNLGPWPSAGRDLSNSRSQPSESRIGPANVSSLTTKWTFRTKGDVSATPTVGNDAVYFPDWAGNLYAVRKETGQQVWAIQYQSTTDTILRFHE